MISEPCFDAALFPELVDGDEDFGEAFDEPYVANEHHVQLLVFVAAVDGHVADAGDVAFNAVDADEDFGLARDLGLEHLVSGLEVDEVLSAIGCVPGAPAVEDKFEDSLAEDVLLLPSEEVCFPQDLVHD